MRTEDRLVPEVRFRGVYDDQGEWIPFDNDWEQRKLGEYVSITSGEAPSKFEVGTELYVKVDDLNYNDKYVVDTQNKVAEHSTIKRVTKGSVIFPKRGAAIMTNKVRILGIDSYMDTNMMSLSSEKLDSEFLYNIISKEGLYKIADTSTIPQINNKHIEPYEVTIPSLDEQKRIGVYFRSLDHLITLTESKCNDYIQAKKSMMQKLFSKQVRFKKADGSEYEDWVERPLGECLKNISAKKKDKFAEVYSVSNVLGFIPQTQQFDGRDNIASEDTKNYKLVSKGQFAYNPSRINVGSLSRLTTIDLVAVSPLYVVFEVV